MNRKPSTRGSNRLACSPTTACVVALAALLATPWPAINVAQETVFFPAPREQRQRLTRAARALEEGLYSDAVVALGELLAGSDDDDISDADQAQDFFLNSATSGTKVSIKAQAQRMLGEMPEQGRKLYELRFGPQARALLNQAIQSGDHQQLVDITRRYFHTKAGYESTLLMGRHFQSKGQPLAAAMNFQRLARWPVAQAQFDPQLSLMLATAWHQSGMPEKAKQTLLDLKKRKPDAGLRIAGKNVTLFAKDEDALPWLKKWGDTLQGGRTITEAQWVMFKGNARRNATSNGDLPLLNDRWRVPTVNDPEDESLVSQAKKQRLNQNLSTITSLQPLAVGNHVIMRTPDRLWAVDFKTGSRIWEYPWRVNNVSVPTSNKAGNPRITQLSQRLWMDSGYGQMSSDGENLFFLNEDLAASPTPNNVMFGGGFVRVNPAYGNVPAFNELMCLSLKREGAIRWYVGGKDGAFEKELAEAYFLGPPLPLQGRLYVLAEQRQEVKLVVLDARTGKLLWHQRLAHLNNGVRRPYPTQRRMIGATPSFSDGVLICPTSIGAVVGLDISTRALLWGYEYKNNNVATRVYSSRQQVQKDNWIDASPIISENYVVITPPESDQLHCLNLLTGEAAKWSPMPRGDMLYVATVNDDVAVVVGKDKVSSINLKTGQPEWDPLKLGEAAPSGVGFFSEGHYFVPTTDRRILKVDVQTGKAAAEVKTKRELGNLICFENNVVSQSTEWVSAYYQRDFLRDEVDARLRTNPDDEWALARKCELLLQDGNRDQALVVLRKTHKLRPKDDVIRTLLVDTLLQLLRDDFDKHAESIDEVTPLIKRPRERAEFARLKAIGLERAGRIREAFDAVVELIPESSAELGMESTSDVHSVRRDRWVAARVASLAALAEGADREHIASVVQGKAQEALEKGTPAALRRFLRGFGNHEAAREAQVRLAELLLASNDLLAAELELEGVEQGVDEITGRAVAVRAQLLAKAGRFKAAAKHFDRLTKTWPKLALDEGTAEEEAAKFATLRNELDASLLKWPMGQVQVQRSGSARSTSSLQRRYAVSVEEAYGDYESELNLVVDQRVHNLLVEDGLGRNRQTLPLSTGQRYYSTNYGLSRCKKIGHLMLANLGHELVAIDTLRSGNEGILWRQSIFGEAPGANGRAMTINQLRTVTRKNPWGVVEMALGDTSNRLIQLSGPSGRTGVIYQKMREIVCVDALSGETIWTRAQMPLGAQLFGDNKQVVVAPVDGGDATILSVIDGSLIEKRPIEAIASRWATWGPNTVAFKNVGGKIELRLYNVLTGETLWETSVPQNSKGARVGGDEIAVMETSGKLTIVSLRDGSVSLKTEVSAEPRLHRLVVLRSQQDYLVVASEIQSQRTNGTIMAAPASGYASPLINGRIHSFDRKSGKPNWQAPVTAEDYSIPPAQALESPVLLLMRNERLSDNNGRSRATYSGVVLDRRDGSILMEEREKPGQLNLYSVTADPAQKTAVVQLGGQSITLKFTEDPTPPVPPAQLGRKAQNAAEHAADAVKRAADALFRNLVPLPAP